MGTRRRKRKVFVGVDIGGSTGKVAIFYEGRELARCEFPMSGNSDKDIRGNFAEDFHNLVAAIDSLRRTNNATVRAIGIGVAGKVADDGQSLTNAGSLQWWIGVPVVRLLQGAFSNVPVVMGNDAKAAGLAEALFNEKLRGCDFAFLIWGTGIGGCTIRRVKGKTVVFPGEPGHINVNPAGDEACPCGQRNCMERYCGGAGMCTYYIVESSKFLTSIEWDEVLDRMVVGVRALQVAHIVPIFVFGGGVAFKEQHNQQLLTKLEQRLRQELRIVDAPSVVLSKFGESAGTWGGYALLLHAGATKWFYGLRKRFGLAA
jgi:glucokinase